MTFLIPKKLYGYSGYINKFNIDLLWNIISFVLIGVIGVTINILIIGYYENSTLGIFNEVFSIYILLSQFATGGIHLSVQKYIPQHSSEKSKTDTILSGAVIITILISSFFTLISYLLRDIPGEIFRNEDVTTGFTYAVPGLFFFSLNKVLLSFINGFRLMKSYAVFMAARYILMLAFLIALIAFNEKGSMTPAILSLAEFVLFLMLVIYCFRYWKIKYSKEISHWIKSHLKFGSKAVTGNILLDINTRVDVLILGIFSNESFVGIYSFASTLSDGFTQLPFVLRTNINPVLTKCYFEKGTGVLERVIKKSRKIFTRLLVPAGIISIFMFPVLVSLLGFNEKLEGGWTVFIILMAGIIISCRYLPYQMIFNQVGFPGIQSLFLFLFFFTNLVLNLLLVPSFGMFGSAIGTGAAYILQIFFLKILLRKKLNIRI